MFLTKNHKVYKFKLLVPCTDRNSNEFLKYYKYIETDFSGLGF